MAFLSGKQEPKDMTIRVLHTHHFDIRPLSFFFFFCFADYQSLPVRFSPVQFYLSVMPSIGFVLKVQSPILCYCVVFTV